MKQNKKAILCHGRFLQATNWELHQFGDIERGLMGQIAKTCLLAHEKKPEIVIFGTGASEKDGLKEAEYIIKYMLDNFNQLQKFPQLNGVNISKLEKFMQRHSFAETNSTNTQQEIQNAIDYSLDRGAKKLTIVSNPDHIARCFQLAHNAYQQNREDLLKIGFEIDAQQSEVGYNGTTQATTKMIEIPHRGDDLSPNLAGIIGKYFGLPLESKKKFYNGIENFVIRDNFYRENSEPTEEDIHLTIERMYLRETDGKLRKLYWREDEQRFATKNGQELTHKEYLNRRERAIKKINKN